MAAASVAEATAAASEEAAEVAVAASAADIVNRQTANIQPVQRSRWTGCFSFLHFFHILSTKISTEFCTFPDTLVDKKQRNSQPPGGRPGISVGYVF
jgi:hypothetical protein